MTETVQRLQKEMAGLTPEERAEMAYLLIESLDSGADTGVEAAWDTELKRRVEDIHRGQTQGEEAVAVFQRVRASLT